MNRVHRQGTHGLGATLILLTGLFLGGCSNQDALVAPATPLLPEGYAAPPQPGAAGTGVDPVRTEEMSKRSPDQVKTIPAPITLEVEEAVGVLLPGTPLTIRAGAFALEVPADAAPAGTVIRVRDVSGTSGRISCELLPHGLQFLAPVRLTAELPDGYDPDAFLLFYVENEGTAAENWQPLPTRISESGGKGIEAFLKHFSTYAPGSLDGKAGWSPIRSRDRVESSRR